MILQLTGRFSGDLQVLLRSVRVGGYASLARRAVEQPKRDRADDAIDLGPAQSRLGLKIANRLTCLRAIVSVCAELWQGEAERQQRFLNLCDFGTLRRRS